ncbi:MAG: HAMP domain-containing sensor histidine kinase [Elusimicrobiota bacterium]|nr:HAMP domain-containing sensor histidine kinase [Elusimicrobiota bacterium]
MGAGAAFAAGLLLGAAGAALAARAVLRRRAALYGRLFSFAMHELNTPVTAVNMTVMNLLEGVFGELPAAQRPWVEMTREQVGRLNALVGEIRDLVHMELHKEMRLTVAEAAPKEVVEEAVGALRRGFELAGVELRVEVPEGLPLVRADADRAPRSLTSLLFHARKFRKGGPVTLAAARGEGTVDFSVTYDGAPLSPEEAAASLDLFYPAMPRDDHQLAATGLGLGLARAVMARTGGELDFSVEPGGRARLTLRLKAAA